jgi:vancomycin resistance protein YoaR
VPAGNWSVPHDLQSSTQSRDPVALIQIHGRRFVLGAATLLAAFGLAIVAAADAGARLPGGVEIAGVAVGGVSAAEAKRRVSARAAELAGQSLLVIGPEGTVRTSGFKLGASPRVAAAVAAAGARRFGRARDLLDGGRTRRIALSWDIDAAAVRELAERLRSRTPPSNAAVTVDRDGVRVRSGRAGYDIDTRALRRSLESLPSRVRAPTIRVVPHVTTAEARATAQRVERLTGARRTILVGSGATELEPPTLRKLVRVHPSGGGLSVAFDAAGLARLLPASVPPRDATFRFSGSTVGLVPAVRGRILDVAATALRLAESDSARVEAAVTLVEPAVTTAELRVLGIRDLVSEFTTYYPPGQPRVVNIRLAAATIDGTIIPPGGRFSMNEALGERTIAKGYVPAPQISGSSFVDSVGGGISQVATMLYNGAFFAGLELIEHQPHSLYIDRYPLGREATIAWGGPELIFRNDWPASLAIKLETTETSITVRFFSSGLGRRVETETGVPYGHGGGSFQVEYTRRVYRGSRLTRDERFRVRYGVSPGSGRPGGT